MSDDRSLYPLTPGHQNTDTSRGAAAAVEGKADVMRKRCLQLVRRAAKPDAGALLAGKSPDPKNTPALNKQGLQVGITAHEAASLLGEPNENVHPRMSELRAAGLVRDSGVRRLNQTSGRPAIAWTPGDDPDKPRTGDTNAPPKAAKQREAYVRGMAAAYHTLQASGPEGVLRRLAELEPGNPDWMRG